MALALGLVLAVVLAGCGEDDSTEPGETTSSTSSTSSASNDSDKKPAGHGGEENSHGADGDEGGAQAPDGRDWLELDSPPALEELAGSFMLTGTAVATEGAVSWELLEVQVRVLRSGVITASCGAPCRGTFNKRISLKGVAVGNYFLQIYEASAKDGTKLHIAGVPVTVVSSRRAETPLPPGVNPP